MTTERIWGLIGVFGLGFIVGRVITKKQLTDTLNEELEELKNKAEETLKRDDHKVWEHNPKTRLGRAELETTEQNGSLIRILEEALKSDDRKVSEKIVSDMEYDVPEPKKIYTVTPEDEEAIQVRNKKDLIYSISTDDFFNETEEESSYDKITLTYYTKDLTLADDRDEMIPHPYSILGEPGMNLEFGLDPRDPDVIYIRNDKIATDFEILRSDESYVEAVLGFDLVEPPLKKTRKKPSLEMATKPPVKKATKPKKGAIEDDNI